MATSRTRTFAVDIRSLPSACFQLLRFIDVVNGAFDRGPRWHRSPRHRSAAPMIHLTDHTRLLIGVSSEAITGQREGRVGRLGGMPGGGGDPAASGAQRKLY